jgi:hypothetical protein
MIQKNFKGRVWIVFLLPLLAYGGPIKKVSSRECPVSQEGLQEEHTLTFANDGPLPRWLMVLTEKIASEHGLSPKLVNSIILTESNGDPRKVSPKGARGLMQLMPVITKEYEVLDPLDPSANIRGGVRYFADLLGEFSGNLSLALAAYNAGPAAVRKYQGIPPYRETQEFVRKVSEIFHTGEDSPHFLPTTLRITGEGSLDGTPANFQLSGSPRSLSVFLARMRAEVREAQVQ